MATKITDSVVRRFGFHVPEGGVGPDGENLPPSVVSVIRKLLVDPALRKDFLRTQIGKTPRDHPAITSNRVKQLESQIGDVPPQHPVASEPQGRVDPSLQRAVDKLKEPSPTPPRPKRKPSVPESASTELKTSLAAARKAGDLYYLNKKTGKKMAAVTKEDLDKSGLSLRDYLNQKEGLTRRKKKPPPKPRQRPSQARGGLMKTGHKDYRKGGLFY